MIIIPARLESSRLHNKPLQLIGKYPLVVVVAKECLDKTSDDVVVATDSALIQEECKKYNIDSVLTGPAHSGTDRVYEAAKILKLKGDDTVLNVQGDCPFLSGTDLGKIGNHQEVGYGSIVTMIRERPYLGRINPNVVKAVTDKYGRALYFSRAPIPHTKEKDVYYEHIGIYAMQVSVLKRFCLSQRGKLEQQEDIEHLRALENGIEIYTVLTDFDYIGVNTPEDLSAARDRAKR